MSVLGFLILLLVAAVCGAVAEAMLGVSVGGCLVSTAVGLVGAFVGRWMAAEMGLPPLLVVNVEGTGLDIVWTILGAVVFVAVLAVVRGLVRRA